MEVLVENQMTEQYEDPAKPLYRRWHQSNFCRRLRAMRAQTFSQQSAIQFNVDPTTIEEVGNGVKFLLRNSGDQETGSNYGVCFRVSSRGIVSVEVQDLKEEARFKLSEWGIVIDYAKEFSESKQKVAVSREPSQALVKVESNLCIPFSDLENDVDTSMHNEEHLFHINFTPFFCNYKLNGELMCEINSKNLLSLERKRDSNTKFPSDSTFFAQENENLFVEQEWKGLLEDIPNGPSAISLDLSFGNMHQLYGMPMRINQYQLPTTCKYAQEESKYTLLEEGEPQRCYTIDHFNEKYPNHSTYGAVPIMMARCPGRSSMAGVFWCNASDTWVDVVEVGRPENKFTHWMSEGGHLQFFIYAGLTPEVVFYKQHVLTGFSPVPANWVLGYQQCRWNYHTQEELEGVSNDFLKYKIPCDSLWLDLEYTVERRIFTFNIETFPNPREMLSKIVGDGRKLVLIIDPHVKKEDNYGIYEEVKERGLQVRNQAGEEYVGKCFPGDSVWMDFLDKRCRDYLSELYTRQVDTKDYIYGDKNVFIWNDMNEPGVFGMHEQTMPKTNRHTFSMDTGETVDVEHRLVHSIYGFYNTKATTEALMKRTEIPERTFSLSRSFFAGSQRFYSAFWTADCRCDWDHFRLTLKQLLNKAIAGIQLIGSDIPGFYRDPPEEQIVVRWYQFGSMMPYFRAHAHRKTSRREPWLFSEATRLKLENIIILRYQYLQYLSQAFFLHNQRGEPVMRPMWFNYPEGDGVNEIDDQFMMGSDLIVRPVFEKDTETIKVWLPKGEIWYFAFAGQPILGTGHCIDLPVTMDTFGLFVKGGTIIPMCKAGDIRSSEDLKGKKFDLWIYLNQEGKAKGFLFLSDGTTTKYEKGEYTLHLLEYDGKQVKFTQKYGKEEDLSEMIDDIQIMA